MQDDEVPDLLHRRPRRPRRPPGPPGPLRWWQPLVGFVLAVLLPTVTFLFAFDDSQVSGFLGLLLGAAELGIALKLTWARHRPLGRGILAGGILFALLGFAFLAFASSGGLHLGHD
jgi:hypothetical protein